MTQTAWHHLPNSALIDQVLAELGANPEVFARAYNAAYYTARGPAWRSARNLVRNLDRDLAFNLAWDLALYEAGGSTRAGVRDAILALIAYDDSAKYLDMSYEELRVWAEISEHPAAILILPYVWVREHLASKVCA